MDRRAAAVTQTVDASGNRCCVAWGLSCGKYDTHVGVDPSHGFLRHYPCANEDGSKTCEGKAAVFGFSVTRAELLRLQEEMRECVSPNKKDSFSREFVQALLRHVGFR